MKIEGKRIFIKGTEESDLSNLMCLWNNKEVMKWVQFPNGLGMNIEKMELWFDKIKQNENKHHFVVLTKDLEFCGEVYYGIDEVKKRASLDIKFLPEFQGKGLAHEAFQLLINMVFKNESVVNAVYTEPNLGNDAAVSLYKKCGLYPTKRPKDLIPHPTYYELTRHNWEKIT